MEHKNYLQQVRVQNPLIHCITNYVTVNDCANVLLACGASPVMADDSREVEEITALSAGLYLNIGTLHQRSIESMVLAGKKAQAMGKPIVLDPVGAGASTLRTQTATMLIEQVAPTVLRGNLSEVKALAGQAGQTRGVDVSSADTATEQNLPQVVAFAKTCAEKMNTVVAITGAIDIVADSKHAIVLRGGHAMMGKVTGTGCMLGALVTACVAANTHDVLHATATAVCMMGMCGQHAHARLTAQDGNATYRQYLIDAVYHATDDMLERQA